MKKRQTGREMVEKTKPQQLLRILRKEFPLLDRTETAKEPFSTLILTVLSQATNDRNRDKAFKKLSQRFEITPKGLAEADVSEIEEAIRIGGLYRNKSRAIKALARLILKRFNGNLDFVDSLPTEQARKILMSLPGVGPKTADVVLLFVASKPVLPIDTHVNRVSKRLGLVAPNADYETARSALQTLFVPEDYLAVHLLLISLGRSYCKARKPLHTSCPVNSLCPSAQ
jgi:endonuclease-3